MIEVRGDSDFFHFSSVGEFNQRQELHSKYMSGASSFASPDSRGHSPEKKKQ